MKALSLLFKLQNSTEETFLLFSENRNQTPSSHMIKVKSIFLEYRNIKAKIKKFVNALKLLRTPSGQSVKQDKMVETWRLC